MYGSGCFQGGLPLDELGTIMVWARMLAERMLWMRGTQGHHHGLSGERMHWSHGHHPGFAHGCCGGLMHWSHRRHHGLATDAFCKRSSSMCEQWRVGLCFEYCGAGAVSFLTSTTGTTANADVNNVNETCGGRVFLAWEPTTAVAVARTSSSTGNESSSNERHS